MVAPIKPTNSTIFSLARLSIPFYSSCHSLLRKFVFFSFISIISIYFHLFSFIIIFRIILGINSFISIYFHLFTPSNHAVTELVSTGLMSHDRFYTLWHSTLAAWCRSCRRTCFILFSFLLVFLLHFIWCHHFVTETRINRSDVTLHPLILTACHVIPQLSHSIFIFIHLAIIICLFTFILFILFYFFWFQLF